MSWIRSPTGRSVLGLLLAFGAMFAVVYAMRAGGFRPPVGVRLGIALAAAVPGVWFACNYWRSLDEAAREAQKWGWFWGGSFGLALGFLSIGLWPNVVARLVPPGASDERLMLLGAATVMTAQLVGFFLAWALWWWRRR
jgi:hypothetical protein